MEVPRRNPVVTNTGPLATAAWCLARGLLPQEKSWFVVIAFERESSRFEIEIYAEEWGFAFHHDGRASWIRVTDIPFVHGRDDHDLLREAAGLGNIGRVLRTVEERHALAFARDAATVKTNVEDGESAVRAWLAEL